MKCRARSAAREWNGGIAARAAATTTTADVRRWRRSLWRRSRPPHAQIAHGVSRRASAGQEGLWVGRANFGRSGWRSFSAASSEGIATTKSAERMFQKKILYSRIRAQSSSAFRRRRRQDGRRFWKSKRVCTVRMSVRSLRSLLRVSPYLTSLPDAANSLKCTARKSPSARRPSRI